MRLRGQSLPRATRPRRKIRVEWCERRLLARIHRLTVATLRKQIEPVTAAQFMRWLLRWQHVARERKFRANAPRWMYCASCRDLRSRPMPGSGRFWRGGLPTTIPKWLDQLCLTGAVGWGRLSPHPATLDDTAAGKRRVIPTSVAPITFFVREEADWMTPHRIRARNQPEARGLSEGARQVLEFLRQRGASFFADIVRGTGRLKAEVETALWELVAAGLVTADGFDNLRSLIDPKRRAGQGSGRAARPRHSTGRWALLYTDQAADEDSRRGSDMLDAAETLRHRLSRFAGPRDEPPQVARNADGFPPAGRSWRDSRRTFCGRISGRAVCSAGGGRVDARPREKCPRPERWSCCRLPTL